MFKCSVLGNFCVGFGLFLIVLVVLSTSIAPASPPPPILCVDGRGAPGPGNNLYLCADHVDSAGCTNAVEGQGCDATFPQCECDTPDDPPFDRCICTANPDGQI